MSVSRKSAIRWTLLGTWFVAGWAVAIQYGIFELKISPTRPTQMQVHAQRYFSTGYYFDPNSLNPEFVELEMTRSPAG